MSHDGGRVVALTYQAVTLVGDWRKKGLQMVAIGRDDRMGGCG